MSFNKLNPIGRVFETLRMRRNLSQLEVAQAIGMSPSLISHWETGRARPTPDHEDVFLVHLEVGADEFYEVYFAELVALKNAALEKAAGKR